MKKKSSKNHNKFQLYQSSCVTERRNQCKRTNLRFQLAVCDTEEVFEEFSLSSSYKPFIDNKVPLIVSLLRVFLMYLAFLHSRLLYSCIFYRNSRQIYDIFHSYSSCLTLTTQCQGRTLYKILHLPRVNGVRRIACFSRKVSFKKNVVCGFAFFL